MNLSDFANMVFTNGKGALFCVFDDEDIREAYRAGECEEPIFEVRTPLQLRYVLNDRYSGAKVLHFYAVSENVLDVIIAEDEHEPYAEEVANDG